jgi:hypothetical protein
MSEPDDLHVAGFVCANAPCLHFPLLLCDITGGFGFMARDL